MGAVFFSIYRLHIQPVFKYPSSIRGEDTFWMKLDASNVVALMFQSHDTSVIALGGNLEAIGEICFVDNPTMVTSYLETSGQSGKDFIVAILCDRC